MRIIITLLICFNALNFSYAQVFNHGSDDMAFRNMIENGVTYIKTGDEIFDSTMIESLEKYWTISEFSYVEQYKKPTKESTALFVTTKKPTKKYMNDRKNQHVLVIQPAKFYHKDKDVPMAQTLGYMYYNGFYALMKQNEEFQFNKYIIKCLNRGLTIIKEKDLSGTETLNEKIANVIIEEAGNPLGNILILNREQITHEIDIEKVKANSITHRLFAKEELYETLTTRDKNQYLLYYSVNTKTELSLINVNSGNIIYTKQFEEGYVSLKGKELKLIANYF